jgi:hypothetical protein
MNLEGVLDGNIAAATEVREAIAGRATTRVEFYSTNDKLDALLKPSRPRRKRPR